VPGRYQVNLSRHQEKPHRSGKPHRYQPADIRKTSADQENLIDIRKTSQVSGKNPADIRKTS
jgi:hypothetical protein